MHKEIEKKEYRSSESLKMLVKLEEHHTKIAPPFRSEMISMLTHANAALRLGRTSAVKSAWVSNAFDGSEE